MLYIRRLSFPLAYASSIVLDYILRKDPAIIFQHIFFKNLIMVVRQTLVSVYILRNSALRPHRLYDRLFINSIVFRRRREDLRVILLF